MKTKILIIAIILSLSVIKSNSQVFGGYYGDAYAPWGFSFEELNDGFGYGIFFNMSTGAFTPKKWTFFISDGVMSSVDTDGNLHIDEFTGSWTGVSVYQRALVGLFLTYEILGDIDRSSVHLYAGSGFGIITYKYEYKLYDIYGNDKDKYVWGIDGDATIIGLPTNVGLILNFNSILFQIGESSLNFKDMTLSFGVGFSF